MNTPHNVLVVEDDPSLSGAVTKKLTLSNFKVTNASSVDEGLAQLGKAMPVDAVWLDHYLTGDKDGLDFVAAVKERPEWKDIPIYVVSNTASEDKVRLYLQLGITKYYVKSDHRLEEIISAIQAGLKGASTYGNRT